MSDLPPYAVLIEWVPIDLATDQWGLHCPICKVTKPQVPLPTTQTEKDAAVADFAKEHSSCLALTPG